MPDAFAVKYLTVRTLRKSKEHKKKCETGKSLFTIKA